MLVNLPADLVEVIRVNETEEADWDAEQCILRDLGKIVTETIKVAEAKAYG